MAELSNKDSYIELYEHQKYMYEIEKAAFSKLEDKASKQLTSLSILITAYTALVGILLKSVIQNTEPLLGAICIFLIVLIFILFCSSWYSIFKCLRLQEVYRLESNQKMIDYFLDQEYLETVYEGLSTKYSVVIQNYIEQNAKKAKFIQNGYKRTKIALILFIILVSITFFLHIGALFNEQWTKTVTNTATTTKTSKS